MGNISLGPTFRLQIPEWTIHAQQGFLVQQHLQNVRICVSTVENASLAQTAVTHIHTLVCVQTYVTGGWTNAYYATIHFTKFWPITPFGR